MQSYTKEVMTPLK